MEILTIALYVSVIAVLGAHFGWRSYRKSLELNLIRRMAETTGWGKRESKLDDSRFRGELLRNKMLAKFRELSQRADLALSRITDRKYVYEMSTSVTLG